MTTVLLGGKQRPLSFGFGAMLAYEAKTGDSALVLLQQFQGGAAYRLTDMVNFIAACLDNGSRQAGLTEFHEIGQVADWLDANPEAIETAMASLSQSLPKPDGEPKKKTHQIKPVTKVPTRTK